jgi:hypothetical protein
MAMNSLDEHIIEAWLSSTGNARCMYPDVAKVLAQCIIRGDFNHFDPHQLSALSQELWSATALSSSEVKSTLLVKDEATA